eukprot:10544474-Prorocentrum_lima.AAC.1
MKRQVVDQASQKATKEDIPTGSALEPEDFKAMICHKHPEEDKGGERYMFKHYNHRKGKPKDMGYWWTGSTWFK